MCFKLDTFLVIVIVMTVYFARSTSSASEGKFNSEATLSSDVTPLLKPRSNELGNKCLDLPEAIDSSLTRLAKKKCYVDKTEYLSKMLSRTATFWFLARPRRFGKTLLVDVMEELFTGKKELFKDTAMYPKYIEDNSGWPEYPVIRIDFSFGISFYSSSAFMATLLETLHRQATSHNIHLKARYVESGIAELIEELNKKYNKNVVILIDEYDSSYTRCFGRNKVEAAKILSTLQGFFSTLKGAYKIIHFCFVTGISRLALSDFFSGANAAVDLTMDPDYAGIVGFNETELCQYFGGHIQNVAKAINKDETYVLDEMKTWHDGFRFTVKNENLYSPVSTIDYLRSNGQSIKSWSGSGEKSQFLENKLKEFPAEALQVFLEDRVNTQADESENTQNLLLAHTWELTGKFDFETDDPKALVALLFHSGYLRIASYDNQTDVYTLEFTNRELKEDFARRLYCIASRSNPTNLISLINSMVKDLQKYQWESFFKKLNSYFSHIPYHLYTNQRSNLEAWFQFYMYLMFHFSTYLSRNPLMEDPSNKGRSDLTIFFGDTVIIFEPKMITNLENPVYECKQKYIKKHLFGKQNVVCVGWKFLPKGEIGPWGTARFSEKGKLLQEEGEINLTTEFSPEETQKITKHLDDFKNKHPKFTLQPEKLIKFLEQIGPTTTNELDFSRKTTEDIEVLSLLLQELKKLLNPNLRGIISRFVERINLLIKKTNNKSDSKIAKKGERASRKH